MADVLERPARAAARRDPRETLEPLLDDLLRALGFEKAIVLLYDDERSALVGSFGIGVPDAAVRPLTLPLEESANPIIAVLRGGVPERIRDVSRDERLSQLLRDALASMGIGPLIAAPLRSASERTTADRDGKGVPALGWEARGEWAGVVLLSRASGVTQADIDALVPFSRKAGEALSLQRGGPRLCGDRFQAKRMRSRSNGSGGW